MRVVVIGGTGHIGTYLTPRLAEMVIQYCASAAVLGVRIATMPPGGRSRTCSLTGLRKKLQEASANG